MLTDGEYKNLKSELNLRIETLVRPEIFFSDNYRDFVLEYSERVAEHGYNKSIDDFANDFIEEAKKEAFDNGDYSKYLLIDTKRIEDVEDIKEYEEFHKVKHKGKYKKKTLAF